MNTTAFPRPRRDATTSPERQRALVLGGGGSTGNAWLIGVTAGLFDAGVDVTDADVTVGTSAGSTATVQLAGADPTELFAAARTPIRPRADQAGPRSAHRTAGVHNPGTPVANHLARITEIIVSAAGPADMRRKMGAAALELEAATDGSWPARWRATVAARLPLSHWPGRTLLITAVNARTGDPVVFDRRSGVDLVDAVAASCSSSLPYRIGEDRYIDGGYRRNENADLASGCERVLVLSPFGGKTLHPLDWGMQLAAQIEELAAGGSRVEAIFPDSHSEHLFGSNAMDLSLRPTAAQAGYDRGQALAERISRFWH